jgi:hypothetical protein
MCTVDKVRYGNTIVASTFTIFLNKNSGLAKSFQIGILEARRCTERKKKLASWTGY